MTVAERCRSGGRFHRRPAAFDFVRRNASHRRKWANAENLFSAAMAYVMGHGLEDAWAKRRAGTVVTALLRDGALVEVKERDPIQGEMAWFIKAGWVTS
jgi:hypothetical protein